LINSELVSAKAPVISVDVRRQAIVLSVVVLAAALRIYAISLYPLAGDEYSSLAEANKVGLNWNSIIYSGLMHFWIRLGSSELWLRLPSAIFGTATVAILFRVGEKLGGWRTGVVAALLAATSPFSIYHSQEVRFYSLFIFASAAFMLATFHYVESPRTPRSRAAVLFTGLVLVFSHFLGLFAVYAQGAATFLAVGSKRSMRRVIFILGVPVVLFGLPLIPRVQHLLWDLHRLYSNAASSVAPASTPISIINLAKLAFAGYIFIFGYHVYPLRVVLVIGGAVLSGFLLVVGAVRLWKSSPWRTLLLTYPLVTLGIYLVLDSVGGRLAAGVAPRHVAFVWPVFLLITAFGLASLGKKAFLVLLVGALTLNAFSIWGRVNKEWVYGTMTDYRAAVDFVGLWSSNNSAILQDGRASEPLTYYFRSNAPRISTWSYERGKAGDLRVYDRVVFVTDDFQTERRAGFNRILNDLDKSFYWIEGRVDYPMFEYVLQRRPNGDKSGFPLILESGQVRQPLSIYGLEFEDLRLPVKIDFEKKLFSVVGAYALPDMDGHSSLDIPLAKPTEATRILVLSNVVADQRMGPVDEIADLDIITTTGQTFTYPLRLGTETALWDQGCSSPSPCSTVYRWHKRMAMLGQSAYAGSYRDFQAAICGATVRWPQKETVTALRIRYRATSGHFYLWGLSLSAD